MVTVNDKSPAAPVPSFEQWRTGLALDLNSYDEQRLRSAFDWAQRLYDEQAEASDCGFGKAQSVAGMLVDLGLDVDAVIAGMLHDVPQLQRQASRLLASEFGDDIARLVQGANRVASVGAAQQALQRSGQGQAEALRKMVLAMASDIRVMFIALAERLMTLRAVQRLPQDRQPQLARQTLQLHASLANRLGVSRLKWELEDLSLRALEPRYYHEIARQLAERRQEREAAVRALREQLAQALAHAGIDAQVDGRPKHIYSIWRKMQSKHLSFDELFDIRALRVRVDTVRECYAALSVAHTLWPNNAAEYEDYIAAPKANNYQSLHTVVTPPDGRSVEIQFRTHEMHEHAELGVAAHWRYKEGGRQDAGFDTRVAWLRELLQWAQDEAGGFAAMGTSAADLFDDHVFAFTPQGDIVDLPRGATPLDFAYCIHTQVGHRCRGARVNEQMVPLTRPLETGDRVEVLTAARPAPSRDWANPERGYLASKRARACVQQWFRTRDFDRDVAAGRAVLERAMRRAGGDHLPSQKALAQALHFAQPGALLAALGRGDLTEAQVTAALRRQQADAGEPADVAAAPEQPERTAATQASAVVVGGVDNLLTRLAACCHPIMGDPIVGFITRRNGIAVHRGECPNVVEVDADARQRVITAQWGTAGERRYPVDIQVRVDDARTLLGELPAVLGNEQAPLRNATPRPGRHGQADELTLQLAVRDTEQLQRVIKRIAAMRNVSAVRRAPPA